MGISAARFLTWASGAAAGTSLVCLALLLAYAPASECLNSDYDSPVSPLHSGGIAFGCLLYSVVAVLVGTGLLFGLPPEHRSRAGRAIALAVLALVAAGGAVFADAARWTCWP